MKITAVVPCYNAAAFIGRAIDSILQQTYPVDEIVVVDDGSTDATGEVVAGYGELVVYVKQENRGPSAARNKGMRLARNEWVAFLDADDWWVPEKIARQVAAIEATGAEICYSSMWYMLPDQTRKLARAVPVNKLWPLLRYANRITPSTVLARRSLLLEAGGFDETLKTAEDWDLWMRLGPGIRYVCVDDPITCYNITPGSLSSGAGLNIRNMESILETRLLTGLSGMARVVWRRRIRAAEYYRAYTSACEAGDPDGRRFLFRSLGQWPSPFFLPKRFLALPKALGLR